MILIGLLHVQTHICTEKNKKITMKDYINDFFIVNFHFCNNITLLSNIETKARLKSLSKGK